MFIDLNADLGEGAGFDAELMPLITSANVCCGLHAGGPNDMAQAFTLAAMHDVVTGAHPGYADRERFGRYELGLSADDISNLCLYQIGAAVALGRANECPVRYVKPHGALYNRACAEEDIADAVIWACEQLRSPRSPRSPHTPVGDLNQLCEQSKDCEQIAFPIVGLPSSALQRVAERRKLPFIPEGFADRRYRPDGSLVPRSEADAFIHDPDEAVSQVEWLIREMGVRTICVHGDNPQAVAFTKAVREALLVRGFKLKPFA